MANFPSFFAVSQLLKYGCKTYVQCTQTQTNRQTECEIYIPLTMVKTLFDITVSQPEPNVYQSNVNPTKYARRDKKNVNFSK